MSEGTQRPLTTMTYLAEAKRLAGNGTREGTVIAMLLAHIEAQDAIFEMRDRRPATATEIADALRAVAEECHRLAVRRGKYPDGWTIQTGMVQIIEELHEWLWEVAWSSCCDRVDRSVEEAGDALAALLSVMVHEGIDPVAALTGALERGRERVGNGETTEWLEELRREWGPGTVHVVSVEECHRAGCAIRALLDHIDAQADEIERLRRERAERGV